MSGSRGLDHYSQANIHRVYVRILDKRIVVQCLIHIHVFLNLKKYKMKSTHILKNNIKRYVGSSLISDVSTMKRVSTIVSIDNI